VTGELRSLAVGITAFHLANVVPGDVLARQSPRGRGDPDDFMTETPIQHIVAVFQKNAPFDHSCGADLDAATLGGEIPFHRNDVTAYRSP
jgi:hypothetical protein